MTIAAIDMSVEAVDVVVALAIGGDCNELVMAWVLKVEERLHRLECPSSEGY